MLLKVGTSLDRQKEQLYLSSRDLKAHAHGIGASRAGKSKLIECIARQMIKERQGVCVIDPSGFLYHDLVQWLAYARPARDDIFLFNPSYEKKIVGFNPFHLEGPKTEAAITAKVDRILGATIKALGVGDIANAPRMERVMRCLYYVLIEQDLSIAAIRFFLSPRYLHIRDKIINRIQSENIRDQWLLLTANKRPETYLNMVESTANRLFKFLTQQTVKRIVGTVENSLNIQKIVDTRGTLLVNLQASPTFSQESARIIGTLFISELWEILRKRTREDLRKLPNFFLVVDEFQNFTTPDFAQMLDQSAKYGLHLLLFHQNLNQLDNELRTALTACHTRFVFGGVTRLDATYSLEGSIVPIGRNLQDYVSAIPSLPSRHYLLTRPDQQIALAYTPDVNDYRVPEDKVARYVETVTRGFLSPDEVDEIMQNSAPVIVEAVPKPGDESANVDLGELLSRTPGKPPNAQKPDQEKKLPFVLTYERARGTLTHQDSQRQIAGVARDLGFKALIEKPVLAGAGVVDVSLERSGIKIACEVSITSTAAWEAKNVSKCLQAGYDHVWVVAFPKNVDGLTRRISDTIPVIDQARFKVLTLGDCFAELRKLSAPVDPKTGKPAQLAGQMLNVQEAAKHFRVNESTIYRWVREGILPRPKVGRKILFDRDLLNLLSRHNLTGKQRTKVELNQPIKIEKPKSRTKRQQDDRYRKMLGLD